METVGWGDIVIKFFEISQYLKKINLCFFSARGFKNYDIFYIEYKTKIEEIKFYKKIKYSR